MGLFKQKQKSCLGIDIGTSSIKVVQLKHNEERYKLETYGELQTYGYLEKLNDPVQTKSLKILESQVVEMIRRIIRESEASAKQTIMSIPVFSSFISVIDLPPMSEKELPRALIFEAKRHIPIALSEVRIDWKIISKEKTTSSKPYKHSVLSFLQSSSKKDLFKFRVLLVAVPKEVITKYLRIAKTLGLKLLALELESFSYIRSLIGNDQSTSCILDFGARSTSFSIADKGFIQMSHSLDIAGTELTKTLSHGAGVDFRRAEMYKRERGLDKKEMSEGREIRDILLTLIDQVILEMKRIIDSYQNKTKRKITKLVLSGGSSNLIGLEEYLKKELKIDVMVGNPWARVSYLPVLEPALKEIASKFAVAIGLAMREI